MSKLAIGPNASGTGTYTLASPNNNASHTLTLPVATGTLLTSDGDGSGLTTLTSANLTGALPAIDGSALTGISGGSTTAGAVGTYAWLVNRTQDNGSAWGGQMAGSSLGSAGLATNNNTNASSSGNVTASGRGIGTTQSGTWQAMGQSNFTGMYDSRTTLFVRIL